MLNLLDNAYIFYRASKATLSQLIFRFCAMCWPIEKNKVVFCSTEGMGGYGDNPKAIAEYLHENYPHVKLVWLVNDINKEFPQYIRKVSNTILNRAREYSTAKIWVDSHRKPYGTYKRKGQYYLQTWHGPIGFKPIGAKRGVHMPRIGEIVSRADSDMIDCFISNSAWCTNNVRESLYYSGPIEKMGSPRCDVLFHDRNLYKYKICEKYGIAHENKMLIYAPTFRGGSQSRNRVVEKEDLVVDFHNILNALQKKTNDSWVVILRMHPQAADRLGDYAIGNQDVKIVDASKYPDVYELLAASDALLTDYSSLAFDAGYIGIPVFLYADNLTDIMEHRGGLLFDIRNLPFPFADTEKQLCENILSFNKGIYKRKLDIMNRNLEVLEDGKASQRAVQWIMERMEK